MQQNKGTNAICTWWVSRTSCWGRESGTKGLHSSGFYLCKISRKRRAFSQNQWLPRTRIGSKHIQGNILEWCELTVLMLTQFYKFAKTNWIENFLKGSFYGMSITPNKPVLEM